MRSKDTEASTYCQICNRVAEGKLGIAVSSSSNAQPVRGWEPSHHHLRHIGSDNYEITCERIGGRSTYDIASIVRLR